ncbi:hypothetical protein ABTF15_18080, partial [Acinetobacter baumannii]
MRGATTPANRRLRLAIPLAATLLAGLAGSALAQDAKEAPKEPAPAKAEASGAPQTYESGITNGKGETIGKI